MRGIIVEDEQANIDFLKSLLTRHCKKVELVGEALDGEKGQG